jgi:hypothetical protein
MVVLVFAGIYLFSTIREMRVFSIIKSLSAMSSETSLFRKNFLRLETAGILESRIEHQDAPPYQSRNLGTTYPSF